MPTNATARLAAGASAAILCLAPGVAVPALAASHKNHNKHAKKITLSRARAGSTALKSAGPLILDPADQVRVTACTELGGGSYECGLELHAANSASTCHWTVVVKAVGGSPSVVKYSHVDCAG